MRNSLFKTAATSLAAVLTLSAVALTTPAFAAGGAWHGGSGAHGSWHGGGWRGGDRGGLGWAGVGLAAGALAGAALATPYYYGGSPGYCDPYYGCGGDGPDNGYESGYGYSQGGNSGGANFPQ